MTTRNAAQLTAQLSALRELEANVQHIHGLVEQFAAAAVRGGADVSITVPLRRAFGRLKLAFTGAGLDQLAQLAAAMEIAAGRGGSPTQRVRILREGVASMKNQIELEQRAVQRMQAEQREQEGDG
ncbi:MAG TPA: hypothetical protein VF158_14730 [Longimicrobiales bacterium]